MKAGLCEQAPWVMGVGKVASGICIDGYTEDRVIYFNVCDSAEGKNECQKAFRRQVAGHLKWVIHVYFLCMDGVDVYLCMRQSVFWVCLA